MEQEVIEKIIKYLLLKYPIDAIYLFGSYASGLMKDDSDLDLAVLFTANFEVSNIDILNSSQELASIVGCDVDLINYRLAPMALKIQILKNKKIIYCSNQKARLYNEMVTLSLYQKLNEERAEILEKQFGANVWKFL